MHKQILFAISDYAACEALIRNRILRLDPQNVAALALLSELQRAAAAATVDSERPPTSTRGAAMNDSRCVCLSVVVVIGHKVSVVLL